MSKITIGVPQSGYNVERNVQVLRDYVQYVRPWDYWRVLNAVNYKFRNKLTPRLQFTFSKLYFPPVDGLHFFNSVSNSKTPWVSTFETSLPRWGKATSVRGEQFLLREEARGFVALSKAAKNIFLQKCSRSMKPSEFEIVQSKVVVLHPPQLIALPDFELQTRKSALEIGLRTFCFVGSDFYRKGGYEMLQAFERLYDKGHKDWRLSIVGDLNSYGDFASRTTSWHMGQALRILEKLKGLVQFSTQLARDEVLCLFQESDFLVFPTIQDTYGYVLLEAMSKGCVPIVSNQRAMPEVVRHRHNGLMFEVPLTSQFSAVEFYQSPTGSKVFVELLFERLSESLFMDDRSYAELRENAIASIRENHDPYLHCAEMLKLYRTRWFN